MRKELTSGSRSKSGVNEQIRRIEARHQELSTRIDELGRRAILTPAEQREISVLKKHKLAAKDELAAAMRRAV